MSELTQEEKAVNFETLKHITAVRDVLNIVIRELIKRGEEHDQEKMKNPELAYFVTHTHRLNGVTYGSDEYKQMLKELQPALDHHYAKYRHHAEHFPNGIDDMNIIDIICLTITVICCKLVIGGLKLWKILQIKNLIGLQQLSLCLDTEGNGFGSVCAIVAMRQM